MSRWPQLRRVFLQAVFPPDAVVASVPLVFFLVACVSLMQFPSNLLMRAGFMSAGILINELVVIAAIPLMLARFLHFDRRRLFPFRWPGMKLWAWMVPTMLGAAVVMDYLTAGSELILPLPPQVRALLEALMAARTPPEIAWKFILLCAVPGFCEELFFRGFCQTSLAHAFGEKRALVATALLFALLHGNPYYLHLYFLLGLFFGWVFSTTGSLWAAIICHVFNNAWTLFNHLAGFKLPIDGVSLWINTAIIAMAALILLASLFSIRRLFLSQRR